MPQIWAPQAASLRYRYRYVCVMPDYSRVARYMYMYIYMYVYTMCMHPSLPRVIYQEREIDRCFLSSHRHLSYFSSSFLPFFLPSFLLSFLPPFLPSFSFLVYFPRRAWTHLIAVSICRIRMRCRTRMRCTWAIPPPYVGGLTW